MPDYVKFTLDDLDLTISFIQTDGIHKELHLGIETSNKKELNHIYHRLKEAGLIETSGKGREDSTCCYAREDKFWVVDPNGYEWEIYTLLENSNEFSSEGNTCCTPKLRAESSSCGSDDSSSCC